ncbi:hypothetical protein GCM10027168_44970 [Streptomyces capparidis]
MNLILSALPEFLGSFTAALALAAGSRAAAVVRGRRARAAGRRPDGSDSS